MTDVPDMLSFDRGLPREEPVFQPQVIPKEMDIFSQAEEVFLPPNKDFKDLTPEEAKMLRVQYRFAPYRPGIYQGITGFGSMIG